MIIQTTTPITTARMAIYGRLSRTMPLSMSTFFVLVKVSSSVYSSVAMPETLPPLPEEPKFVACGGSSFVTAPSCPF